MTKSSLSSNSLKRVGSSTSQSNFARNTMFSIIGLLLAKMTGFVREMIVLPLLGYGSISDAYYLGFQIPDLFYQLLIGGAISATVTPAIAAALERGEEKRIWKAVNVMITFTFSLMVAVIIVGEITAPYILKIFAGSRPEAIVTIAVDVTRRLFPQTLLMALAGLVIGILNAYQMFRESSVANAFYNVSCITFMFLWGEQSAKGATGMATGVTISAGLFFLYLLMRAFKVVRRNFRISFDFQNRDFRRLIRLAIPTLISGSVVQINQIILTIFTNELPVGVMTSMRNSNTIWTLPYGIFAVGVGAVLLPALSGHCSKGNHTEMRKLLTKSIRSIMFMVLPFAMIFLIMRFETIQAIFQWKKDSYSVAELNVGGDMLLWYALVIPVQSLVFVMNQVFYAHRITKVSLFTGIVSLVVNPILALIFVKAFALGATGLAIAYLGSSLITATLLYYLYCTYFSETKPYRLTPYYILSAIALVIAGVVLAALNALPIMPEAKVLQLVWYCIKSAVALIVFYQAALMLNIREARNAQAKIRRFAGMRPAS